jgi:carbonic anhydrase
VGVPTILALSVAQDSHATHWTYDHPEQWGKLDPAYSTCSEGRAQSPIDVKDAARAELPGLSIDYKSATLNIIDNGHTIQVNYAPGSSLSVGTKTYALQQFHFHHPSEEKINGKNFPLVAHLVHADDEGHLAVIAVLFEIGSANGLIDTLWRNIPVKKEEVQELPSVAVQAGELLPRDLGYFTFKGSLTTPPCSEGVEWYVLQRQASISPEQLAIFSRLYPLNARPIQPTNGREILQSK